MSNTINVKNLEEVFEISKQLKRMEKSRSTVEKFNFHLADSGETDVAIDADSNKYNIKFFNSPGESDEGRIIFKFKDDTEFRNKKQLVTLYAYDGKRILTRYIKNGDGFTAIVKNFSSIIPPIYATINNDL